MLTGGCADPGPAVRPPERTPSGAGVYHVVRPGETVWRIAHRYGVPVEAVVRANHIRDVHEVPVGVRLWIPHPADPEGGRPVEPPPPPVARPDPARMERDALALGLAFGWPLRGRIHSRFGGRRHGSHDGIDIGAPKGAAVRAAEAGRVIFSGKLGDYGRVVIVKHVGDWSTVYAHNRRNRVDRGDFVEKGDRLADVGESGNATGPHLHFEIRRGQTPVDPLRYLP